MRNAETTLAIIRERGRRGLASRRRKTLVVCHHCHVAIHRGTLTNRLKALIDEGKLTPTGEWVLPSQGEPMSGKVTQSAVSNGETS